MTVLYRHEVPLLEKSFCDPVLHRWRINLVSLVVFAILISDTCDGFVSYLKTSTPEPELFMCELNKTYPDRNQCLYLSHDRSRECMAGSPPCKRTQSDILRNVHLPFCSFSPVSLMTQTLGGVSCRLNGTLQECQKCFDYLEKLDKSVQEMYEDFEGLLDRYDCGEDYSVSWDCNTCKHAYKVWLCATAIPHYLDAIRIQPCQSVCSRVAETCPFFRPDIQETHAGDPRFLCKDPHIHQMNNNTEERPNCFHINSLCNGSYHAVEIRPYDEDDSHANSGVALHKRHPRNNLLNSAMRATVLWLLTTLLQYMNIGLT